MRANELDVSDHPQRTRNACRHADRVVDLTDSGARYPERRHTLIQRWREQMCFPLM